MFVAAITHSVADYDAWKEVFDRFLPTARGALFARVNRSVDDPNRIAVVAGFDSLDAAHSFLGDPELKERMGEAGVTGEPRIEVYEEVFVTMA